ncbi:helix-turn-helix transcriptional regulator [uncultured Tateyamaria sp.]|uniref:helix-turn-helix domain-containing protein n=1 Tax=uncultured Tateyamaria sp. TaxID=455651 RepID=UPI002626FC01|nr:helix-turn-helix transcriptional regulator [uncultured Tateyamaria sp.]
MEDAVDWYSAATATFGDRVAAAREAAGMSQKQLAKRLGVRLTTLRGWEDDLSEPRANRLSIMAGLLNVSMMWLINGEGEGLVGPLDTRPVTDETRSILTELRDLRADMLARAEQVARLEKRLRATLDMSGDE